MHLPCESNFSIIQFLLFVKENKKICWVSPVKRFIESLVCINRVIQDAVTLLHQFLPCTIHFPVSLPFTVFSDQILYFML